MKRTANWPDGTTRSRGNAFDWNGASSVLSGGRIKTARQLLLDANRVNKEVGLGEHGQADRTQKISRASI